MRVHQQATESEKNNEKLKNTAKILKEYKNRFRCIYESNILAIAFLDVLGNITDANVTFLNMFGYSHQDLQSGNVNLSKITPPEYTHLDEKATQDIKERGFCMPYQKEFFKKNGSRIPILFGCAALECEEDLYIAYTIDMTNCKQVETAFHHSEKRFKELADSITDVFFAMNRDLKYAYWNRASERLTGIAAEDAIGKSLYEIFPDIKGTKTEKAYLEVLKTGKAQFFENEYQMDNKNYIFEISVYPTTDGCSVFVKDITERKKMDGALRQNEEHLRSLFETMAEGVVLIAPDGQIVQANPAAECIVGLDHSEIKSRNYIAPEWEVFRPDGTPMPWEDNPGLFVMREKRPVRNFIMGIKRTDDSIAWLNANATPLMNAEGTLEGIVGTFTDITDRIRLEEQLEIRQRMDSLGTLAGGIAHDFNNLLTGIMGFIDMLNLDYDNFNEIQRMYINSALQFTKRASDLVKQLQTFSQGIILKKTSIDLFNVIEEVFSILEKTTDRLIKKKNQLKTGKYFVKANASELSQVFLNLGTNAVHAIEARGVKPGDFISIKAEDYIVDGVDITGLPEGNYVRVFFEDNGCGMPDEIRRRAFDPFFSTKKKGEKKGQGLGLAMVFNIITRNHGGYINIESTEGKGTTFHIYLPKCKPSEEKKVTEDLKGGNETALIIEDEEEVRDLAKLILCKFGYKVLTGIDGKSGLDIYKKNKTSIDLVLLDLTMPGMSGKMVFERIIDINPLVKVIICSGQSDENIMEGILAHAHGFLKKPYHVKDLLKTVRSVLEMKKAL